MTTPKTGSIPIRQGQAIGSRKVEGAAPKTKFESVLKAAAKASRGTTPAAEEEAQIAEAKDALGLAIVRSLLKNQKPGDIERDKAVEPEDD